MGMIDMVMEAMGSTKQEAAESKRKMEEVAAAKKLGGEGFTKYAEIQERALSHGLANDEARAMDRDRDAQGQMVTQTTFTRKISGNEASTAFEQEISR